MPHRSKEPNYSRFVILGFVLVILVLAVVLGMKMCPKEQTQPSVVRLASDEYVIKDSLEKSQDKPQETSQEYSLDYLMGKTNKDFVMLTNAKYTRLNLPLHPETLKAFQKMYDAADSTGISLKLLSGMRSWDKQKSIWENELRKLGYSADKSKADKIRIIKDALEYISLPGSSRHHWGTEIDIYSLNGADWTKGDGKKAGAWLKENAHKYGFYLTYTDTTQKSRTGFSYEPWHWSYKPLSQKMYQDFIAQVKYSDFKGFSASDMCEEVGIIENYIKGINPELK